METKNITINFAGSIDTKSDPHQLSPNDFAALNNSVYTVGGQLTKRNGFPSLGSAIVNAAPFNSQTYGENVSSGRLCASYKDELVINDGFNLFSYLEDVNGWSYKGRSLVCNQTDQSILKNTQNQANSDSAISNVLGQTVFAYEDSLLGLAFSLIDNITGQVIINYSSISATGSRPQCVAVGSFLYIFYFDSSDSKIHSLQITSSGAGSSAVLISNNSTALPNFCPLVIGSNLYIAYNGASSTVKINLYNSSLSLTSSVSKSEVGSNGVGIFSDASNDIWCCYGNGTAVKCFIMDSTLSTTVLVPTIVDSSVFSANTQNVTGAFDGTNGVIFFDQPGVPAIGPGFIGITTTYTQPAVGATVVVTTSATISASRIGQNIAVTTSSVPAVVTTAGYYTITAVSSTSVTIRNLGYIGTVAPGGTITNADLLMTNIGGYSDAKIFVNTLSIAGTKGNVVPFKYSAALNSKAFIYNNIANVIMIHDDPIQPTYFMGSLYNYLGIMGNPLPVGYISAKIFASSAGVIPDKSTIPSVNITAAGKYQVSLQERDLVFAGIQGGEVFASDIKSVNSSVVTYSQSGITSVKIDFTTINPNSIELGENLIIGSGIVNSYDGVNVNEQNFNIYPSGVTINGFAISGGLLTTGTYGYIVTYEWTDNQGQINRSFPSPVISVAYDSGSPQINYLTIPTLRLTEKNTVNIVIYRTKSNGTVYFRLNQPTSPLINDQTLNYMTYIDNAPDSSIGANDQLYTTGEVGDNSPPSSLIINTFKNRAMLVPSDDQTEFWYSKQVISGFPVELANVFVQNVGSSGGAITAISQMDDKFIIFKSTQILYMVGTGPAASGANNDFTDPLPVAVDCGAIDRSSVVLTPNGLIFKSDKGIYLLDRSLQASYIGAPVEAYNQYNVFCSQLIPDTTQVRFILSSGVTLMYDYFYKRWATFSNPAGISNCIFQGHHTYISANGLVYKEAPGVYYDGTNTPVLVSFTMANMNFASVSGYERILDFIFLAKYISSHQLQLNIAYDYQSPNQQVIITPNSSSSLEQWRIHTKRQLCQSFQISLIEVYTGTLGAAFTMSGITFRVGLKKSNRPIRGSYAAGLS